jgi:hypothetical protein
LCTYQNVTCQSVPISTPRPAKASASAFQQAHFNKRISTSAFQQAYRAGLRFQAESEAEPIHINGEYGQR